MKTHKELIEEYVQNRKKAHKKYLNQRYEALGNWHLDLIDQETLDRYTESAWIDYQQKCTQFLYHLANQSNEPLVKWLAHTLNNKSTAFSLIKRMPLDLAQIDTLMERSRMNCASYKIYRKKALEAGVVREYK